jgi:tungstate transport system substrate-binding protein
MKRTVAAITSLVVFAGGCSATSRMKYAAEYGNGERELVVATGSPGELGLLKALGEAFADKAQTRVLWYKAGSGQSLELLHKKEVDLVMVHAPQAEQIAVGQGWAVRHTLVGSNEFYTVGPADDPAGVGSASTAAQAYRKIAERRANFLSRADNSGTHTREMTIWRQAGIDPKGPWYIPTRDFMMAALLRANAQQSYFMTDSSTWIVGKKNTLHLRLLFKGDPVLMNVYHALCQPLGATPGAAIAGEFVDFLVSKEAQQIIRTYGIKEYGQPLY